jgi:hypothetical protein
MIFVELFDAGTKFVYDPRNPVPGMDQGYYRELDMEYDFRWDRREDIRNLILGVDRRIPFRPWPTPLPGNLWVDWSMSYYGAAGGLQVRFWHYDFWGDKYHPVPAELSETQKPDDQSESIDPDERRVGRELTQVEVREKVPAPDNLKWLRLELKNETGQPQLKAPVVIKQGGHAGTAYVPTVNFSPCFLGCDLTKGTEWYGFIDDDGNPIRDDKGMSFCHIRDESHYRFYLAPAKWRITATVYAHFWYGNYFESYGVLDVFTKAWFTRPSVYPEMHDVIHTKDQAAIEWYGADYAYDAGVQSAFERSRGSLELAQEIIAAQWWTLCEFYIFLFNDPALIALWQYPPDPGDIVMGIGRVDQPGGMEERVWVVQKKNILEEHPREVIGLFFVPWNVV